VSLLVTVPKPSCWHWSWS